MATEQSRSGIARRTNLPARPQGGHGQSCDLFRHEQTCAIWRAYGEGLFDDEEAQRRLDLLDGPSPRPQGRNGRLRGQPYPPAARPRSQRPAPQESLQYANPTATTAARDDRLTPNAKALLQVIRARCGKGTNTATTKGTLAAVISRSTRTVCRYLRDLERWGYIETETRKDHRGYHLGLMIRITAKVLPYFHDLKRLAKWLGDTAGISPIVPFMPFATSSPSARFNDERFHQGMTVLSSKNPTQKDSSYIEEYGREECRVGQPSPPH